MNQTNTTDPGTAINDAWQESGAMVYVALTVAIFSMVTMCCVWFVKKHRERQYNSIDDSDDEEEVELTAGMESSEEDLQEATHEDLPGRPDQSVFTMGGDSSSSDEDEIESDKDSNNLDAV